MSLTPTAHPGWRWSNVPLPERYLGALGVAWLLHVVAPLRTPLGPRLAGAALLAGGAALAGWAVASAGKEPIDRPDALITTGAYRLSRNPMYVGWGAAVLGTAVVRRSPWLLLAWLQASRELHREVADEERELAARFGAAFDDYRARTPRYADRRILSAWLRTA